MIAFAQPWALLWLLSLPVLIYLYRLRPQREDARVSTLMFWQQALKIRDSQRNFRRWLRDLNLLLLLLLALLFTLALARPQWQTAARHSQDAILIIDTSASMGARTGTPGRNRFDEAKTKANQIIAALPQDTRLLVMTSARHARPQSGFESDRDLLSATVARLQPTEERGNPLAALTLARTLLRNRQQAHLHFITDGAFDADPGFATAATEFHFVGDRRTNLAITRFDVRTTLHTDNAVEVFAAIRNYGDNAVTVPFAIAMDAGVVHEQRVNIDAGGETTLSLPVTGQLGSRATATITTDDALQSDNAAYMAFSSPAPRRVLLVTPGNFYLETALRELPDTTLEVKLHSDESLREQSQRDSSTGVVDVSSADDAETEAAGASTARSDVPASANAVSETTTSDISNYRLQAYDVVVFDRVSPPPLDTGRFLLIDVPVEGADFTTGERTATASVAGAGQHALMRDIDLSQLRVASPRQLQADNASVQALFWSDATDLGLSMLQPDKRIVYLGFNLLESNFPRQAAFPLFIRRSVDWLTASTLSPNLPNTHTTGRERRRQIPVGESFTLQFAPGTEELVIATPDGSAQAIALTSTRYTFTDTSQAGLYQYTADGVQHYIAANLTDDDESSINRRLSIDTGDVPRPAEVQGIVKISLWPYLAWAALLLLTIEWWLWFRRREHA